MQSPIRANRTNKSGLIGKAAVGFLSLSCVFGFSITHAQPQSRASTVNSFSLALDGINCGMIKNLEGGDISGEVVKVPNSADYFVKKHIGNVKYNDFTMDVGLSMGQPVRQWIEASMSMNYMRKSGELKAADFKRDARQVRQFKDALISEIGFPACDGSSKEAAYLTVKITPENIRYVQATIDSPHTNAVPRPWISSNFKLSIAGLDCSHVTRIDGFSIPVPPPISPNGNNRDFLAEPGKIDFPNLTIYMSEEDSRDFAAWHEDFVINGNNEESKHKTGSLVFLNANRQSELLTLNFSGLGIFKMTSEPATNNSDKPRVKVQVYCERMDIHFGDK